MTKPKLAYLHFSYDDTINTIHRYYIGTFSSLSEHLGELIDLNYNKSSFTFSDKPFPNVEANRYVEIK